MSMGTWDCGAGNQVSDTGSTEPLVYHWASVRPSSLAFYTTAKNFAVVLCYGSVVVVVVVVVVVRL